MAHDPQTAAARHSGQVTTCQAEPTTTTDRAVHLDELSTPAACERAAELLRQVWQADFPPVAGHLLRTVQHTGGYVFGAHDDAGDLVAVSLGLLSREGLHSHITGVLPAGQRRGLGLALKRHQRSWALERGLTTITWTCDPLVRRNVAFNLHALGARVVAYLPDHYGVTQDGVNAGDASDRLEVHWDLTSPEATAATTGRLPWSPPAAGARLVPLPADVERLRAVEPRAAWAWRRSVRASLLPVLAGGGAVLGMTADGALVVRP